MKKLLFSIAFLGLIAANVAAQTNNTNPENEYSSENGTLSDFLSQVLREQQADEFQRTGATVNFVNTMRDSFSGAQIGFINTTTTNTRGAQVGFVNTTGGIFSGAQVGFLNTIINDTRGAQVGFVNTIRGNQNGGQVGFINTTTRGVDGAQIGFVNTTISNIDGAQIGFVNIARRLTGLQFGFVNFADEVENGVPIGFLSIVRRGGFRAIELSASEFHPVNVGFKIGVEQFYTIFSVGYNPFADSRSERFATGIGVGTIVPINESFFFNPEIIGLTTIGRSNRNNDNGEDDKRIHNNRQLTSFVPFFGYNITDRFSVAIAPTVTWSRASRNSDLLEPVASIAIFNIDDRNEIVVGARVSVRWRI